MLVEEHESRRDLCSIETGTRLVEFSGPLNLEHEVSTVYIFHDEKEAILEEEKKVLLKSNQGSVPLGILQGQAKPYGR